MQGPLSFHERTRMGSYYRLYCPKCSTPDPRPRRGLLPWLIKVLLRRRQFACQQCGYRFEKQRRQFMASVFSSNHEEAPPVYLPAQGYAGADANALPGTQQGDLVTQLLRVQLDNALAQRRAQRLLAMALELTTKREALFLEQQRAITTTQKHLGKLVGGLNEAIDRAAGDGLPPFTIIPNPERQKNDAETAQPSSG